MTDTTILRRLRLLLLALAGLVFMVTPAELLLTEHFGTLAQFIPFLLCAVGLIAVLLVLLAPRRATVFGLRAVAVVILAGSLLGVYEHLVNNLAFELDIRPGAVPTDVLLDALKGASPMMAPGILAFGALAALAATYYHPALVFARTDVSPPEANANTGIA